ncbi:MAG: NAD(P)H-hydrate dehydratase [Candidatus Marinimicrobia bacterium]|nr:NAD(P)H-hydrate dehydratase [Candidatus Neomarinimicrobiota bacterium]MBL7023210.1 NAD(P)H-hydrate dehydratase [Candidatus Neomarinimicrobiota bacterium]MBL7109983.1 NAD(P)H-hydrate dehydratase [Candidatus Neomarinimicrobiota bacterium]
MIPVLSEDNARKLDKKTASSGHLSEPELMENAGRKVAEYFIEKVSHPFKQKVVIVCGKGNNGGDGIVAHYYLQQFGVDSTLLLISKSQLESDLFSCYAIESETIKYFDDLTNNEKYDCAIDSVFGIGLKREITGKYRDVIQFINLHSKIIAVDIASGLYCDTGKIGGVSVNADVTITMGYPKLGQFLNDGITCSGKVEIVDIGFKDIDDEDLTAFQIDENDIANKLKSYPPSSHKYSRGRVGILSGSIGMTGAGILVNQSAGRSGCGIIRTAVPMSLNTIFETSLVNSITNPIDDKSRGYLNFDNYTKVKELADWAEILIVGPGLSTEIDSQKLISRVLIETKKPTVLDASGFEPLVSGLLKISDLPKQTILTPHIGEYSRIFGFDALQVKDNPAEACKLIIEKLDGRTLLLKGNPTIIVSSSGKLYFVNNGTPILATAGTGDVLTGIIGGLLAQQYSADDSAIIGAFVHAEAGRMFEQEISQIGLVASDLVELIPEAFQRILDAS